MMKYSLRTATAADLGELDRIYTENMQAYVEKVYPWQPNLFRDNFVATQYQVIELNQNIIGFLKLVISTVEIYLGEIQIASSYQNRGIGSKILRDLIQQARIDNQRIWLKVIRGNRAIELYRRLGFVVFATSSTHFQLELAANTKNS